MSDSNFSAPFRNPLVLALDLANWSEANLWFRRLGGMVGGVKLGSRLLTGFEENMIRSIAQQVPLFIDEKYFDIPQTVAASVTRACQLGALMVTIHGLGGEKMIRTALEVSQAFGAKIAAVTFLTSWDEKDLVKNFQSWSIETHVQCLMDQLKAWGIEFVVCSSREIRFAVERGLKPVVPGVRLRPPQSGDDQKRWATPQEAILAGAHALVIGRPILQSMDPEGEIKRILGEISSFF